MNPPYTKRLSTPVGALILSVTETAVVGLGWENPAADRSSDPDGDHPSPPSPRGGQPWAGNVPPLIAVAERQLREYFRRERKEFELPFDLKGTEFQRRVWGELAKIPYGKTWTYRELAARVDNPGAVRAVGTANGRNPVCIFLPCHRVVRSGGETGGYAGGTANKSLLLSLEGALPESPR
jgi:methylated-DNA-[protein]-cysteine S-methyltransferase